ncbi:MAG TPA: integration host factor, actinobacterial type [Thermoleophilaceae bacterium]|nr:integration host factor, actinobacterial type [Thermoleophilaceae bacterium]
MSVATESPSKPSSAGLTPERSLDQRKQALKRANEIRMRRARLKRELKAGKVAIQALLLDPPQYLLTAKVFDMLMAVPKYGRVKAGKVLRHCRVSHSKTFQGLSERQRKEIVDYLTSR